MPGMPVMPGWYLVSATALIVVVAVVLIVRVRLHPAVVLALAAATVGLATGLGVEGTVEAATEGFGDILAEAGLLIAFGVLIVISAPLVRRIAGSPRASGRAGRPGWPRRSRSAASAGS